jgi:hypothetical protein
MKKLRPMLAVTLDIPPSDPYRWTTAKIVQRVFHCARLSPMTLVALMTA